MPNVELESGCHQMGHEHWNRSPLAGILVPYRYMLLVGTVVLGALVVVGATTVCAPPTLQCMGPLLRWAPAVCIEFTDIGLGTYGPH